MSYLNSANRLKIQPELSTRKMNQRVNTRCKILSAQHSWLARQDPTIARRFEKGKGEKRGTAVTNMWKYYSAKQYLDRLCKYYENPQELQYIKGAFGMYNSLGYHLTKCIPHIWKLCQHVKTTWKRERRLYVQKWMGVSAICYILLSMEGRISFHSSRLRPLPTSTDVGGVGWQSDSYVPKAENS